MRWLFGHIEFCGFRKTAMETLRLLRGSRQEVAGGRCGCTFFDDASLEQTYSHATLIASSLNTSVCEIVLFGR